MKKRVLVIIICLVALIGVAIIIYISQFKNSEEDVEMSSTENDLKIVTETFPTKFIVYGDKIEFNEKVNVEYVTDINEDTLAYDENYKYQMVIINDLNSNAEMTDDEWLMLYAKVTNDKRYNCFYLGDEDFEQLSELEIINGLTAFMEGDLSIGFVYEGGTLITVYGTYTKNATYDLSEALLHEMSFGIRLTHE